MLGCFVSHLSPFVQPGTTSNRFKTRNLLGFVGFLTKPVLYVFILKVLEVLLCFDVLSEVFIPKELKEISL